MAEHARVHTRTPTELDADRQRAFDERAKMKKKAAKAAAKEKAKEKKRPSWSHPYSGVTQAVAMLLGCDLHFERV